MLTFLCGVCKTQLQTPDEHAGKLVQCPKCKTTLRAPTPAPTAAMSGVASGGEAGATALDRAASPTPLPARSVPRDSPVSGRPMGGKRYGFNCQYCSSRLETVDSLAGHEGDCPTCGNKIIIPILDRYGRLIDPMSGTVIKPDPHPVHAYAANGERAPRVVRREDRSLIIQCPKCKTQSPITANNCKQCGMPFTMEGTTADASGGANGAAITGMVLGILGLLTFPIVIFGLLGLLFGYVGRGQAQRDNGGGGQGIAIAAMALGGVGLALGFAYYLGLM